MLINGVYFEEAGTGGVSPAPAASSPETSAPPGGTQQGAGGEPKFTQADLDRIMHTVRGEAASAATTKLLKDLGVEKPDDLKAILKAHKEAEDAKRTDAEKAQAAMADLQGKLAGEQTANAELKAELQVERIHTAVILKAMALDFDNPEDAFALLDMATVEVTEDGKIKGFEKALEDLAKSGRLKMKATTPTPPGRGTPPVRGATRPTTGQTPPVEQPQRPLIRF